jgi:hypothetical protein
MQFESAYQTKFLNTAHRIIRGGVISYSNDEILAEGESTLIAGVLDAPRDGIGAVPGHDVNENFSLRHTNPTIIRDRSSPT